MAADIPGILKACKYRLDLHTFEFPVPCWLNKPVLLYTGVFNNHVG